MENHPTLLGLDKLPDAPQRETHAWADYIELLCLANVDHACSKAQIIDRFRDRGGMDEDVQTDVEDEEFAQDSLQESALDPNDQWEQKANDWFKHFEYRAGCFKGFYPFVVSAPGNVLKVKSRLSRSQKLYLFLLLASCQRYVHKGQRSKLSSSFEQLSAQALKNCLPPAANVHVFGTSAGGRGRFRGNKWQKVNQLATCLGEQVICDERDFSSNDSGEGGLDLVGWLPLGDNNKSLLIAFGQSAATPEWVRKQHESSFDSWNGVLTFCHRPNNFAFIPFCFRGADGSWSDNKKIHSSILVDRARFIHLIGNNLSNFRTLPAWSVVESALSEQESIF